MQLMILWQGRKSVRCFLQRESTAMTRENELGPERDAYRMERETEKKYTVSDGCGKVEVNEMEQRAEKNLYGKAWKACSQCKKKRSHFLNVIQRDSGRAHPGGRCAGGTAGIYNRRKPKGYYACKKNKMTEPLIDRLLLNEKTESGKWQKDLGDCSTSGYFWRDHFHENKAKRTADRRKRVPLGVVGIIYEARPNVTADAFGLCFKTGNVAVLKGGSAATNSCRAIARG